MTSFDTPSMVVRSSFVLPSFILRFWSEEIALVLWGYNGGSTYYKKNDAPYYETITDKGSHGRIVERRLFLLKGN